MMLALPGTGTVARVPPHSRALLEPSQVPYYG